MENLSLSTNVQGGCCCYWLQNANVKCSLKILSNKNVPTVKVSILLIEIVVSFLAAMPRGENEGFTFNLNRVYVVSHGAKNFNFTALSNQDKP